MSEFREDFTNCGRFNNILDIWTVQERPGDPQVVNHSVQIRKEVAILQNSVEKSRKFQSCEIFSSVKDVGP